LRGARVKVTFPLHLELAVTALKVFAVLWAIERRSRTRSYGTCGQCQNQPGATQAGPMATIWVLAMVDGADFYLSFVPPDYEFTTGSLTLIPWSNPLSTS